jgi:integrase
MAKEFTAKAVQAFRPHKTRREIHDGGCKGLYLYVQPSGAKSWVLLLKRSNGRSAKLHLGEVDLSGREAVDEKGEPIKPLPMIGTPLTLAAARALAADLYRQRKAGKDVIADCKSEKQIRKAKANEPDSKFGAVAQQFIAEYAKPYQRRWKETAHHLGLDYQTDKDGKTELAVMKGGLAERWQDREVAAITSDDVYRIVDETKRRGIPGLPCRTEGISNSRGRAMARTLSKLFGWALQHRKITASPSIGVFVPPSGKARERVLTDVEIAYFWGACDKLNEPFGAMLKLLLLTGARLREVAGMRRAELSEDRVFWTIPATRTKNKKEHVIPLPPLARDILAKVKQIKGQPGYIFSTTGRSPVAGFSKTKQKLDELMTEAAEKDGFEIARWRQHDLRRSCATLMAESPPNGLGIAPHIVEACLNHISGHKVGVAGVYNRAQYLSEKVVAFQRWATFVEGMVKGRPANVTPIRRKKGK